MSSNAPNSPDNAGGRSPPAGGTSPTPPANTGRMPDSAAETVTTSSTTVPSTRTIAAMIPTTPEQLEVIDGYGHVRIRRPQPQTQPQSSAGISINDAEAAIMHAAANIPVDVSNTNVYRMPGTDITADARRHDAAPFQTVDPAWLIEPWLPSWNTNDPPAHGQFNAGELGVAHPLVVEQQEGEMRGRHLFTVVDDRPMPVSGSGAGAGAGAGPPHPSHTDFGGQQGVGQVGAVPSQTGDPITLGPIEGGEGQSERTPGHVSGFGAGAGMQPAAGPLGSGSGQPAPSTNLIPRGGGSATRAGQTNPFGWSTYDPVHDEPVGSTPDPDEPPQQGADDEYPTICLLPDPTAGPVVNHPQGVANPPPRVNRSPGTDHPRPVRRGRGRGRGTNSNPPPVFTEPVHGAHGPRGTSLLPPGPAFPTGSGNPFGVTTGPPPRRPRSRPRSQPQIPITRFSTDDEISDRLRQLPTLINEQHSLQIRALSVFVAALPEWRNQPPEARARHVQNLWMDQSQFFERIFIRDQNIDRAFLNTEYARHGRPPHPLSRQRFLLEIAMRAANGLPQEQLSPGRVLRLRRVVMEAQLLTMRAWTHFWRQRLPLGHPGRIDPNIPFNDGTTQAQNYAAQSQAIAAANGASVEDIERAVAFGDFMESR